MKFSKSLIATLREDPKEAESKSHRILLRGGFIKQLASGIHTYLPLGWRILMKISTIIREELDRIGGQELLLPAISPKEIWEASGRWREYGDDMFRFKDRKERDYCLCPTHEEIITDIARTKIRSYRDMPQIWYQIQTKFRDEPRPRFGVIRSRQFIMKDSYSLDVDEKGLDVSFNLHKEAYTRIFKRCGLIYEVVEASGGLMGTGESKEFMARVESGEDIIVACTACDYRANLEAAQGRGKVMSFEDGSIHEVHTPGKKTVDEVSAFLHVTPSNLVKTIVYTAPNRKSIIILLRGDYDINEATLHNKFSFSYQPASAEEINNVFGAEPGYIGPQGIQGVDVYADDMLKDCAGMITGANRNNYHIKGLNIKRDVRVKEFFNLRTAKPGDTCIRCGGKLELCNGLELGHIFKLGTKYTEKLGATFLDETGKKKPIVMGSYGIGLERIMACACEQKGDDNGAVWPISITPFDVYLVVLNPSEKDIMDASTQSTQALTEAGFSVIVDNRDISAGIKFNDSDLLGIPIRVTFGPKGLQKNLFDIYVRETKEIFEVERAAITAKCVEIKEFLYRRING
jgi:prolyl-tRNA synthetase